jgi:putative oxidoreductase
MSSELLTSLTVSQRRLIIPQFVWRVVDFCIGGLFIYAGVIKAMDPIGFANDIDNYKTVPWVVGVRLAFYLPWLEILCGLALIVRRLYLGGIGLLTALISVFIIASIVAKARGIDISCGCFGHLSKDLSFTKHLVLDLIILGGLIALWLAQRAPAQRSS